MSNDPPIFPYDGSADATMIAHWEAHRRQSFIAATTGTGTFIPPSLTILTQLCALIGRACRNFKTYQRITLVGHCGTARMGGPGVLLDPNKDPANRFGVTQIPGGRLTYPPSWALDCVRKGIAPGGILTLCSCGYQGDSSQWSQWLQNLATKLGRTVCACPTTGHPDAGGGCWCEDDNGGRAKKVCRSPLWWSVPIVI
jgi:hypothetical protein